MNIIYNEETEYYTVYALVDGEPKFIDRSKDRAKAEAIAGIKYVPLQMIQQELEVL